ncbi:MAG: TonB-dependent receptor [Gammaproteobacteria bacterium]|nr:TonB-dependent receptor [Gammaproteobacteria bacterium]
MRCSWWTKTKSLSANGHAKPGSDAADLSEENNMRQSESCLIRVALAVSLVFGAVPLLQAEPAESRQFDIDPQPLDVALLEFSVQAKLQLVVAARSLEGVETSGFTGEGTAEKVLVALLDGTGLKFSTVGEAVTIKGRSADIMEASIGSNNPRPESPRLAGAQTVEPARLAQAQPVTAETAEPEVDRDALALEEIVVTGTRIRGIETLSPSVSFTRDEFYDSGMNSVEDFLEALPQNLGEISASGRYAAGVSRIANSNVDGTTAISLRGLGPESTLSLLNGRRYPAAINGRVFDVGAIPLSVIERVDVLTGGASAIYGSDAVAGVVNLVTRKSYDGLEAQVYGGFGRDGGDRRQASVVGGMEFENAGFVLAYDYQNNSRLDATAAGVAGEGVPFPFGSSLPTADEWDLLPERDRQTAFVAGHYDLADNIRLQGDIIFTEEESYSESNRTVGPFTLLNATETRGDSFRGTAGLTVGFRGDWNLQFTGTYGERDSWFKAISGGSFGDRETAGEESVRSTQLSLDLDGTALTMGTTDVLFALGIEHRTEVFRELRFDGRGVTTDIDRDVSSGYGELRLPFITDGDQPGLRRFEINAAVRYDDYSDIGDTTEPQVGVIYAPGEQVTLRGTWGTSFRAPSLFLFDFAPDSAQAILRMGPDPMAPGGFAPILVLAGASSDLTPEEAETFTLSLDYEPEFLDNTTLTLSYFDIDYENRIDEPTGINDAFASLNNEAIYAPVITRMPTREQVNALVDVALANTSLPEAFRFFNQSGLPYAHGVDDPLVALPGLVLFNNQRQNIGLERIRGLDLSVNSQRSTSFGVLSVGFNASYYFEFDRAVTVVSPFRSELDRAGRPVNMQFRARAGLDRGLLSGNVYVNYTDNYVDVLINPEQAIRSHTTVDLSLRLDGAELASMPVLGGFSATFSVTNLFDRSPPKVAGNSTGLLYDATNANAMGRYVSLRLVNRW